LTKQRGWSEKKDEYGKIGEIEMSKRGSRIAFEIADADVCNCQLPYRASISSIRYESQHRKNKGKPIMPFIVPVGKQSARLL
jgi:hypothetical protein